MPNEKNNEKNETSQEDIDKALAKPITRKEKTIVINKYGRKRYTRVAVEVDEPPALSESNCKQLFDPLGKTLVSIDTLVRRLDELRSNPPADGRYYDPCTKRLLPSFASLEKRLHEIRCFAIKRKLSARNASSLQLQLHQDIIVTGIQKRIGAVGSDNRFLIGVLPRGGKTYISGGCIREYMYNNKIENMNVLWMTAAPAETKTQVEKELVGKFSDFKDFDFIDVKNTRDLVHSKKHAIYFVSSQLLALSRTGRASHRPFLEDLLHGNQQQKISMVFFDEAHKTGSGDITKKQINELIDTYKDKTLPFIFLTATYYKVQRDYSIMKENTFIWDYTDVQLTRLLDQDSKRADVMENLEYRFGKKLVDEIFLNRTCVGESLSAMAKSYADYPDLHFLSFDFNDDALQLLRRHGITKNDKEELYDQFYVLANFFKMKEKVSVSDFKTNDNKIRKDAYMVFENLEALEVLLTYLTPSSVKVNANMNVSVPPVSHSLLQRIDSISKKTDSRFDLTKNPSLLMFMPAGRAGTNIFFTLAGWSSLLMKHPWWNERYEVVCVVEEENLKEKGSQRQLDSLPGVHVVSKNLKETILALEMAAGRKNKGLVVLAGEKMSAGISLPFIDVVMLLNDKTAVDDLIQKLYRAVTPSPGKKTAFIVDLNPKRIFTAIYGYTKLSSKPTAKPYDIMKIMLDTYYWDADLVPKEKERYTLRGKRDTFQGFIRSLFLESGEQEERIKNLESELARIEAAFEGKAVAPRMKYSVDDSNLTNPENIETLKPFKNEYTNIKKRLGEIYDIFSQNKETTKKSLYHEESMLDKKMKDLIPPYAEKIVELRKRRKELEYQAAKKNGTAAPRLRTAKQLAANERRAEKKAVSTAVKTQKKIETAALKEAEKTRKRANANAKKAFEKSVKNATKLVTNAKKAYTKEASKTRKKSNTVLAEYKKRLNNATKVLNNLRSTKNTTRKNTTENDS